MDWLPATAWGGLAGPGGRSGRAELFSLDLVLLMLAAGALVGMVAAWSALVLAVQVARRRRRVDRDARAGPPHRGTRLQDGPDLVLGYDALVGRTASGQRGLRARQVRSASAVSSGPPARTTRPRSSNPAAKVDVFQIKGATALVHAVPELDVLTGGRSHHRKDRGGTMTAALVCGPAVAVLRRACWPRRCGSCRRHAPGSWSASASTRRPCRPGSTSSCRSSTRCAT